MKDPFASGIIQVAPLDPALAPLTDVYFRGYDQNYTLIIVTEDDVQDGPDHVDSHRGPAFVVGPYVKRGAVVSTRYNQVSVLRTIEDVLGTQHINLNTAFQQPMADVFDIRASGTWTYAAEASTVLATTTLALARRDNGVEFAAGPNIKPRHSAAYWDKVTAGFDGPAWPGDRHEGRRLSETMGVGTGGNRAQGQGDRKSCQSSPR